MTLNCKGTLLDLTEPKVMGILNITPDSFYDGGRFQSDISILKQAEKLIREGAAILDIGGMSSRPGANLISDREEYERVISAIEVVVKQFATVIVSIDTVRSSIAKVAVDCGASIVNDISAGSIDAKMFETVAYLQVPYIVMHNQGLPSTTQHRAHYENVTLSVLDYLIQKVKKLRKLGVKDIVVDPGFGFGKNVDDNYQLMKEMNTLKMLDLPILVGISRKSMIYKLLDTTPEDALVGTIALNAFALTQGANIAGA
jgi:dihydropteroate synthase